MKVLAEMFSPEASLLGLKVDAVLLCPHMVFTLCMHAPGFQRGAAQVPFQGRTCLPLQRVQ